MLTRRNENYTHNVQSFIDDADSLRRKRQKLSNSSSSILFKHAETEKREYIFAEFFIILQLEIMVGNIVDITLYYHRDRSLNLIWDVKIMLFVLFTFLVEGVSVIIYFHSLAFSLFYLL